MYTSIIMEMEGRQLRSHGGYGVPENNNKTLKRFRSDTLDTFFSSHIGNGVRHSGSTRQEEELGVRIYNFSNKQKG